MFPEFHDLISRLKNSDSHFTRLLEKHNEIDKKIKHIESGSEFATDDEAEKLKKERLYIKDELYAILKKKSA